VPGGIHKRAAAAAAALVAAAAKVGAGIGAVDGDVRKVTAAGSGREATMTAEPAPVGIAAMALLGIDKTVADGAVVAAVADAGAGIGGAVFAAADMSVVAAAVGGVDQDVVAEEADVTKAELSGKNAVDGTAGHLENSFLLLFLLFLLRQPRKPLPSLMPLLKPEATKFTGTCAGNNDQKRRKTTPLG